MSRATPGFAIRLASAACWGRISPSECLVAADRALVMAALPILAVIAPIGAVIVLQALFVFTPLGTRELVGSTLVACMLLEVAPAFVALLAATQIGSSYAAELGTRVIRQEIDYHEVAGVDPYARLVIPRIVGLTAAAVALSLIATAGGVASGFAVAIGAGVSGPGMLQSIRMLVRPGDLGVCAIKAACFGAIVAIVSLHSGMTVRGGPAEVGRAANRAIVRAILAAVILNYFLATLLAPGNAA